ncbi:MAG: hypothetical protein BGO50_01900 [Rhodanobacter sp. 67-28]|nr:MAG: hypothetical protein ABS82_09030 [Rhodanobacter sp. SCN 67-45]OJW42510.1 MAG: hypothetical protein BGO50_01900 [Rhodanobacter sp. 67-28]
MCLPLFGLGQTHLQGWMLLGQRQIRVVGVLQFLMLGAELAKLLVELIDMLGHPGIIAVELQ